MESQCGNEQRIKTWSTKQCFKIFRFCMTVLHRSLLPCTRVSSIEGISNPAYTKSCLWARICVRLCGRCWSLSPPREVILGPIKAQSVPISTNTRCVVDFLSPWTSLLVVVQGGEVESMKFRSKKVQGFSRMDLNGQCQVRWRSWKVSYATCIPFFWRSAYSEVTFGQNPGRRYDPTSFRSLSQSDSISAQGAHPNPLKSIKMIIWASCGAMNCLP